jgi:hypothetical protein
MAKAKTKPKTKRPNYKKAAAELASCVIFALKFYKEMARGTSLVWNPETRTVGKRWEEKFFDALLLVGHDYDREAYYKARDAKKRRR